MGKQMDRQIDRQTDRYIDRQIDRQTNKRVEGKTARITVFIHTIRMDQSKRFHKICTMRKNCVH